MSRRIEKCHICKGTGLITVDDWLVKGMTEEQIAKAKEEALADVAREIFEEIEELAKIYTFPVVKNGIVEIAKEPFWCIEPSDIAELKKKYQGGEPNGQNIKE